MACPIPQGGHNQCLLFATHAHTIAACFAAVKAGRVCVHIMVHIAQPPYAIQSRYP